MSDMQRLGRRLRKLRESADLSQVELSKETGISQNYISSLELGKIQSPSMELLCILGHRFNMTPNDIALSAGWWSPPKQTVAQWLGKAEMAWSADRLSELPAADRRALSNAIRQMVSAAYQEAHGHAPPAMEA